MNILITGGLGNIGIYVVNECLKRGHSVTIFDVSNNKNQKLKEKYRKYNVKVYLGDIRKYDDIAEAVDNQDVIIHMAAILPPTSEAYPDLCDAVNINGTENLIESIHTKSDKTALVLVSSASVMGPTQHKTPPVRPTDPVNPIDVYTRSKVKAEYIVATSSLPYCILRLAAVMPTYIGIKTVLKMIKVIFDMPLGARCEIVYDLDVAYALVSSAENLVGPGEMNQKIGFIGGGKQKGCQIYIKDMLLGAFRPMGLDLPEERLFPDDINSYYLDWYDTDEIQSILQYQRYSFSQWQNIFQKNYRFLKPAVFLFKKNIMKTIEQLSSRHRESFSEVLPNKRV